MQFPFQWLCFTSVGKINHKNSIINSGKENPQISILKERENNNKEISNCTS